ncbi:hypothetical protein Q428_11410 [Fervidicella metallireducens AeB]|uniref:Uncharacterized protein n=1 Tax=Fervidicella metallireducens AeB TaxID=1403537 RepID=A0A017RT00_9CLOT|nr:hypothetical protein Q428_11410 [Fervidicella metallireducens AeB]
MTVIFITLIMGLIICLYAFGIMTGLQATKIPIIFIFLAVCIFLVLLGTLIFAAYERIKEIKEEDKDDISKY